MTIAGRDGRFTRRPVPRADLYDASPETHRSQVDDILEAFAARRLVVLDNSTAQIAHDALLREWPRLRAWLAEDQATWVLYGQLAADAAEWQARERDPSFLYRGTQLASVRQAAGYWSGNSSRYPALTAPQQAFLQASTRATTRATRQRRILSVVLVLLLIASLAGATIAIQAARNAMLQRSRPSLGSSRRRAKQSGPPIPSRQPSWPQQHGVLLQPPRPARWLG